MAGPYNIPPAVYEGTDPDPVEWANLFVKPAIEDIDLRLGAQESPVQFVVSMTGATQTLGANTFSIYPLDAAPTTNIGGGTWNSGTFIYTVPSTGLYLSVATVRIQDNQAVRDVAIGIDTTLGGGVPRWCPMGSGRSAQQYVRIARFTAGAQVRLYIYSDTTTFPTQNTEGGSLSLIKLAS